MNFHKENCLLCGLASVPSFWADNPASCRKFKKNRNGNELTTERSERESRFPFAKIPAALPWGFSK
ncbi:MAG: hypothetical protein HDT46_08770 [Ruminococcaceae bacterium]|nr:hypothetical protein [Oscillospiraceae bacterium]